ncbi:MAG: type II toxin-antitoxin system HicB family antitoxin [Proteobacteria bacterium]|jgi:predicted HicB family RNase H-like nuclease|nr:type II toxin-antitoxin system HicB family antitoxin [Pseudomonadota bacterium]MBU1966456.1 type II toxin-antitoxin system HicB family antitoxin [Pseudomonadota bacterium]
MKSDIEKYTYRIEWSEDDHCHVARCLEFPSLAAHSDTIEEALREIGYVVSESVKWMLEEGEAAPKPLGLKKFKGLLTLRIPPEKHRDLAIRCAEEGVSLNRFILSRLST